MFLLIPTTLILIGKTNIKTVRFNLINSMQNYIASFILFILALAILSYPTRMYFADILYERAKNLESKNMAGALLAYTNAVEVFPANNPFYLADSAYKMAVYTESIDKTEKSDEFIKKAVSLANAAQKLSPENIIITRRVANSYLLLSEINEDYVKSALENGKKLISLAPNDPQSFLTLAKIQTGVGKEEDAKRSLETALALKPDYLEARELFDQLK
jgi:tetratricopeptide (TPR) repeat protein